MANIPKFLLGIVLIAIAIVWFIYERSQFLKERKKSEYVLMSYTIEFILGALILLGIGIRLMYDSFNA